MSDKQNRMSEKFETFYESCSKSNHTDSIVHVVLNQRIRNCGEIFGRLCRQHCVNSVAFQSIEHEQLTYNAGGEGCVSSKSYVRAIICFLLEEVGSNEIYLHLCNMFGEHSITSKHTVYQWIEKFKAGRSNMEHELCSGWPSDMLNEDSSCVWLSKKFNTFWHRV